MMELKTHIEYLEHQEAPPVVVEGDSAGVTSFEQKLERCFDRVAAAENSSTRRTKRLGLPGTISGGAAKICGVSGPVASLRSNKEEFNDELSVMKTQLGSQIDTTKTQLGEQLDSTKTQLGQIGEFNH